MKNKAKKNKSNKNIAAYPELKLTFEGELESSTFVIKNKDHANLNSMIEQGISLHLYRDDFAAFYRDGNKIIEMPVEISSDPDYEYQIKDKNIDAWLNLENMRHEPIPPQSITHFLATLISWASKKKIKIPPDLRARSFPTLT